jgi:chromosome segregation ATPase
MPEITFYFQTEDELGRFLIQYKNYDKNEKEVARLTSELLEVKFEATESIDQLEAEIARLTKNGLFMEEEYLKLVAERDRLQGKLDEARQEPASRVILDLRDENDRLAEERDRFEELAGEKIIHDIDVMAANNALLEKRLDSVQLKLDKKDIEKRELEAERDQLKRELEENHCCVTDRDAALIDKDRYKRALDEIHAIVIDDKRGGKYWDEDIGDTGETSYMHMVWDIEEIVAKLEEASEQ